MPPYPREVLRHLEQPTGGGSLHDADALGSSGAAACGDVVHIGLRIHGGRVRSASFQAFGCGAALAAASAACELLDGVGIETGMRLSRQDLDDALGGLRPDRAHGPELVEDAVARAFEDWFSARLGQMGTPRHGGRVAVAMSGGVDSAVAALVLRDAGWDVVGVTMRLWHDPGAAAHERSCCSPETVQLARRSAHALGIPHLTLDAAERFRQGVVEDFVEGYRQGRTPNPCVTCNGHVRFRLLAEAAALLGAERLATGHYARVVREGGRARLRRAADASKDQSYMLARLEGPVLDRLLFPLGGMRKERVRRMAASAGLPAADAVESQEICFVGEGGYRPFLERHADLSPRPGPIVDEAGRRLGDHDGYWRFTVGQRRGIGVASEEPLYVLATDPRTNQVVVGSRERLLCDTLELGEATVHDELGGDPLEVRVRYRGASGRGWARPSGAGGLTVDLLEPVGAVAPGQTAALYRRGRLVAAGTIARSAQGPSGGS